MTSGLPVVSIVPLGPAGPATAVLPLAPITVPAITLPATVLPLGAAPRPGPPPGTAATPGGTNQQPRSGRQNPTAYGANDGAAATSFRPGYGTYLRNAGLGQMAAVAIPGVAGILVLTAAGGLVGYRQARAGHSVHSTGTTRFVG